jgi:general secretion pathway protein G
MQAQSRKNGAFTLVELLVVILILGILAALIIPRLFGHQDEAKVAKAKSDISELTGALTRFRLDTDRFPTDQEGFQALLSQPGDVTKWNGPYIESLPNDPWDTPYVYHDLGNNQVEVLSYGGDHAPGGDGINADISNLDATPTQ